MSNQSKSAFGNSKLKKMISGKINHRISIAQFKINFGASLKDNRESTKLAKL